MKEVFYISDSVHRADAFKNIKLYTLIPELLVCQLISINVVKRRGSEEKERESVGREEEELKEEREIKKKKDSNKARAENKEQLLLSFNSNGKVISNDVTHL